MTECICAVREAYDEDGKDVSYIFAYNTACPVAHTEEELSKVENVGYKTRDMNAWKPWYGAVL